MSYLLDTCTFLWMVLDPAALSPTAAARVENPANHTFLSAVSDAEIAVKWARGLLVLQEPPDSLIPTLRRKHWVDPLPLDEASALRLAALPPLHRDPFDRLLVAQALVHNLILLTPDALLRQYPVRSEW